MTLTLHHFSPYLGTNVKLSSHISFRKCVGRWVASKEQAVVISKQKDVNKGFSESLLFPLSWLICRPYLGRASESHRHSVWFWSAFPEERILRSEVRDLRPTSCMFPSCSSCADPTDCTCFINACVLRGAEVRTHGKVKVKKCGYSSLNGYHW